MKDSQRKAMFAKRFKDQKFEKPETHTTINKSKYPIGSKWFDTRSKRNVKIVGHPLNDYYHDDYLGVKFTDKPTKKQLDNIKNNEFMMWGGFGAVRAIHLSKGSRPVALKITKKVN